MKFNTQGLALVIVFQLFIVGATLSITATNAGAAALDCAIPETASEKEAIGTRPNDTGLSVGYSGMANEENYLTTGEISVSDFTDECKKFTKFRKVFRNELKTQHDYCSGIGEECKYSGSAGCGIEEWSTGSRSGVKCECEIEFTYCTQTATSNKVFDSKRGK